MLALDGCNGWLTRSSLPSSARFPCLDVRSRDLSPPCRCPSSLTPPAPQIIPRPTGSRCHLPWRTRNAGGSSWNGPRRGAGSGDGFAPGDGAMVDDEAESLVEAERAGRVLAVDIEASPLVAGIAVAVQRGGEQQRCQTAPPPRAAGAELPDPRLPDAGRPRLGGEEVGQQVRRDLLAVQHQQAHVRPERVRAGVP